MIDLVSDTCTRPTPAMLAAAASAPTGDEQRGADPTTAAFESRVAAMLGKERGLFLPSATMANQIALALHVEAGGEVIAHRSAHVIHYEGGGTALIARAQPFALNTPRGIFTGDDVRNSCRERDPHYPPSGCVVVENTSNGGGGSVWPRDTLRGVYEVAKELGLAVHVDGARLWHAAAALEVPLATLVDGATTVQVCFSKGLGGPFGAILALPESLWFRARRFKQALGGALRQSGVITAMLNVALDENLSRLGEDHARAKRIADALRDAGHEVEDVDTNLVFCVPKNGAGLQKALAAKDIHIGAVASTVSPGPIRYRLCTHRDLSDDDVDAVCAAIATSA